MNEEKKQEKWKCNIIEKRISDISINFFGKPKYSEEQAIMLSQIELKMHEISDLTEAHMRKEVMEEAVKFYHGTMDKVKQETAKEIFEIMKSMEKEEWFWTNEMTMGTDEKENDIFEEVIPLKSWKYLKNELKQKYLDDDVAKQSSFRIGGVE